MATQFGAEYEEIGYEGTIENEDGGFVLFPDGDYDFTVNKVTRSRYEGNDKMPSCNTVSVEHGEQLVMRWNIEGDKGKCKVYIDNYKRKDGSDGQSNKIKKFYAYDENVQTVSSTAPPQQQYQTAPTQQYQQSYQTSTQQSTWQQPTQSSHGWAAGKF